MIYVDDLLIMATNDQIVKKVKNNISSTFKIRELGEVKYYLNIEISKSEDGAYSINQEKYIEKVIQKFGLQDTKISKIPLASR